MFVAITIQPSILRTATAFSTVLASALAEGFLSSGEFVPFSSAVGFESTSISVDIVALVSRGIAAKVFKLRAETAGPAEVAANGWVADNCEIVNAAGTTRVSAYLYGDRRQQLALCE